MKGGEEKWKLLTTIISQVEQWREGHGKFPGVDTVEARVPGVLGRIEQIIASEKERDDPSDFLVASFDHEAKGAFVRLYLAPNGADGWKLILRKIPSTERFSPKNQSLDLKLDDIAGGVFDYTGLTARISEVSVPTTLNLQDARWRWPWRHSLPRVLSKLSQKLGITSHEDDDSAASLDAWFENPSILLSHFLNHVSLSSRNLFATQFDLSNGFPNDGHLYWRQDQLADWMRHLNTRALRSKLAGIRTLDGLSTIPNLVRIPADEMTFRKREWERGEFRKLIQALQAQIVAQNYISGTPITLFDFPVPLVEVNGKYRIILDLDLTSPLKLDDKGEFAWEFFYIGTTFQEVMRVTRARTRVQMLNGGDPQEAASLALWVNAVLSTPGD